jgi:hypothetical protein
MHLAHPPLDADTRAQQSQCRGALQGHAAPTRLQRNSWVLGMAVYRLFQNKAFEPEAIAIMTRAHADVCRTLGVSESNDPEANTVAQKVIEFAQRGERDPVRLREHVLQALRS